MTIEDLMHICQKLAGTTTDIRWEKYIKNSHELVASKLTRKKRTELGIK